MPQPARRTCRCHRCLLGVWQLREPGGCTQRAAGSLPVLSSGGDLIWAPRTTAIPDSHRPHPTQEEACRSSVPPARVRPFSLGAYNQRESRDSRSSPHSSRVRLPRTPRDTFCFVFLVLSVAPHG
uniref:Uncharacterized protein n=1 Tax=Molossus molossus TaxID=27622 RepID=A0A7J8HZV6_MOLMO|nr:hypothetical protein HJG59_010749 [Molossus molossus]